MTITLDNSISGVNFNGSAITEVQYNGIKVWPVTPPTPLGVFEYTQTISDGDEILIVSTDIDGTAYVLGHNGTTLLNDEVEIIDGKINGNHLDSGSVWSATSYNTGFILSNNGYNLYINASNSYTIQFSDYLRSVFYCGNNQLQTNIGSGQRWITYEDDTFKVRNYTTYAYFFRKVNT